MGWAIACAFSSGAMFDLAVDNAMSGKPWLRVAVNVAVSAWGLIAAIVAARRALTAPEPEGRP